jgi:hypothetical protein
VAAEHPVGTAQTLIGGSVSGASGSSRSPRAECHRPPPLFIAQATGAHQPDAVGRPRSGRGQGLRRVVGLERVEIILTFSPLISTLLLTLYFHFIRFILDQSIGHVSSSQLYCR